MRIAVVSVGMPNGTSSGGSMIPWAIARYLKRRHEVSVIGLGGYSLSDGRSVKDHAANLERDGISTIAGSESDVRGWLNQIKPDRVFAYHFEALRAVENCGYPVLGIVSDPPHWPEYYRFQMKPNLRSAVEIALRYRSTEKESRRLLNTADSMGSFAAHEAEYWGVPWYRIVIEDEKPPERERTKSVALIGHYRGTATRAGLYWFAANVLPYLEGVDVHVIGGHDMEPSLKTKLKGCQIRGYIPDLRSLVSSIGAVVVPTPIPLGARVRVLWSWMMGVPVIAHRANAQGIPDLKHNFNCYLAERGEVMASAIRDIVSMPSSGRQIGENGRKNMGVEVFARDGRPKDREISGIIPNNLKYRGGILPAEMAAFLRLCDEEHIDTVIESGRGKDAFSTQVLGEYQKSQRN